MAKVGNNKIFGLYDYYQSIENTYPEFSKKIALRGIIHFDTIKELVTTKDLAPFANTWSVALNTKDIMKYTHERMTKTISDEMVKSTLKQEKTSRGWSKTDA